MGILGGSNSPRRLGRNRLYVLFLAPLSTRERYLLVAALVALLSVLLISRAGASNSEVGSIFEAPVTTCSADKSWTQADQAAGHANATDQFQSYAFWIGGDEPLQCAQPALTDATPKDAVLSVALTGLPVESIKSNEPSLNLPKVDNSAQRRDEYPKPILPPKTESTLDDFLRIELRLNQQWQLLSFVNQSSIGNGGLNLELPVMTRQELADLQIRLIALDQSEQSIEFGIDSLSVYYTVSEPAELSLTIAGAEDLETDLVLAASTTVKAKLDLRRPGDNLLDGLHSAGRNMIGTKSDGLDLRLSTVLVGPDKTYRLDNTKRWLGTTLNGHRQWDVEIDLPRHLKPGRYELRTSANTDSSAVEKTQEVLYGVVAINMPRSNYQPGESVDLFYSVLDEAGRTVCDAQIETKVIDSSNRQVKTMSTLDGTVRKTDTCELYGSHIDPDYKANFSLDQPGKYTVKTAIKTSEISYELEEELVIAPESAFWTERSAPTRIYPVEDYDMNITLHAQQDFSGVIHEDVPLEFKLVQHASQRPYNVTTLDDQTQRLSWELSLQAGDVIELNYRFDAPDISPEFYLLGPLRLEADQKSVFVEPRKWQLAGDAIGHMLLFYDGASIPTGWTCVSCSSGDPFFQRFARANDSYGATGGAATHNHTASMAVDATNDAGASLSQSGAVLSDNGHTHTGSLSLTPASNLPSYRQLKIIRSDTSGEPSTLPAGAIGLFDDTVPTGWTQYSAQDGYYVRGENTAGTTGGANSHDHPLAMTINAAAGATHGTRNPTNTPSANAGHTHTVSGNSSTVNQEPPFIEVILGELNSASAPPDNLISMWDDEAPSNWAKQSGSSGNFYQRFIKASSTFGSTGGNASHSHIDAVFASSGPSGSTSSRSGSSTASDTHTHDVNITNFSDQTHLPPYIDVVVAKKVPQSDVAQSAYRFYRNLDSTDVGTPLAGLNTSAPAPRQGSPFRLRFLLHVSNANLDAGNRIFKLQYAQRSGTCDTSFNGETYSDLATGSGPIRYYDNPTPADGSNLTTNANDPVHSTDTVRAQTYEEANNFTNSAAISSNEDGLWDVALIDFSAVASTTYCFRVVDSNGDLLENYNVIPELTTDDGNGHLLLLYDGGGIPSGWSCVSCNPGDDFYQRFFRGSDSYGSTGGAADHNHTGTGVAQNTTGLTGDNIAGSGIAADTHTHGAAVTIDNAANLPPYRQLKVIKADTSGVPTTLPAGAIAFFDNSVPTGWTRYATQDGSYVRAENTVGATGGALNHTHPLSGTLSASNGTNEGSTNGQQVSVALDNHTHTITGTSTSANHEPPFIETILGQIDADDSPPQNIITMWDGPPPGSWTIVSASGQPFYQRFIKPAVSFSTTGGASSHTHANSTATTSVPDLTSTRRSGSSSASGTHVHTVNVSSISNDSHLPPYIEVIMAKQGALNTSPDNPSNLNQVRPSDNQPISLGGWANSGQVRFEATATDTDNPDDLQLCVEVELIGTAFDDTDTICGTSVAYTGSAVTVTATVSGLSNGDQYHWQVRIKDSGGGVSSWVSFGGNPEANADFVIDSVEPDGTVYDGSTTGVDSDFNNGALDVLSANWDITDNESGIANFEYAIGTVSQGTDVLNWTDVDLAASATANSLSLRTAQIYFVSVRALDNAGNESVISSDGLFVAPTLTFSTSPGAITFDTLGAGNNYTDNKIATLTTSTNAYGGYEIRAYIEQLPTNQYSDTIGLFNGGSYAAPDEWQIGDTGYGYTSNDNLVAGSNRFNPLSCAGGGSPPCFAPFATVSPGDVVADNPGPIQGSAIANENFIITHRVTVNSTQAQGTYSTNIIYSVTTRY